MVRLKTWFDGLAGVTVNPLSRQSFATLRPNQLGVPIALSRGAGEERGFAREEDLTAIEEAFPTLATKGLLGDDLRILEGQMGLLTPLAGAG